MIRFLLSVMLLPVKKRHTLNLTSKVSITYIIYSYKDFCQNSSDLVPADQASMEKLNAIARK